jgi:hypothetical protein
LPAPDRGGAADTAGAGALPRPVSALEPFDRFLATPDCSVILAYIGNRAVAIEPRVRGFAKLYDIRMGF